VIYVDPIFEMESRNAQAFRVGARNGHRWCHMFADENEELHALAKRIGLKREWFQEDRDGGHYDLTPSRRAAAVRLGAIEVSRHDAACIWWAHRALRYCRAQGFDHERTIAFLLERVLAPKDRRP
jgi:hypothetical protein